MISGVLAELVLHPERHVFLGARQHRGDLRGHVGARRRGGRPSKPHGLTELRHRRPQPSRFVGREDLGEPGGPGAGVVEQFQDRRFVDDGSPYEIGVASNQVERDDRS